MASLRLGDIGRFPFVEPPDKRNVTSGVQLLEELGAVAAGSTKDMRLTKIGQRLARLPIDPRLARMIVEAERLGCVREVVVIAAALSLQDPRERPEELRAQADQLHARFKDETSDFLTWLNLWRHLKEQQRELSSSAFRRMCKREFLNYLRVREWQDFESQLRQVCKEMRIEVGHVRPTTRTPTGSTRRCCPGCSATSVCSRSASSTGSTPARGRRPMREYLGARGARFAIFPGSGLAKKQPQFLMAGELVETSRLWARQNAAIKPEWAEQLAGDLAKTTYSEPHWSKKRAAVMAHERVTLYGVPLVADRLVAYGKVDRDARAASSSSGTPWSTASGTPHQRFYRKNLELLQEAEELEHRARRRGIVVDEHTLFDFYDARIGPDVVSGAHFDQWWKQRRREPTRSCSPSTPAMLTHDARRGGPRERLPRGVAQRRRRQGLTFPISYHFEPGAAEDGLTIDVPVATLNRVSDDDFSWNVPGLREELVTSLIRSLPKNLRVSLRSGTRPGARRSWPRYRPVRSRSSTPSNAGPARPPASSSRARRGTGPRSPSTCARPTASSTKAAREQARGKDLEALKAPLRPAVRRGAWPRSRRTPGWRRTGETTWVFGDARGVDDQPARRPRGRRAPGADR